MTTTDRTYNGWTNYETWAVGLYLDGNYDGESTYRYVLELAAEHKGNVYGLSEALRDMLEESPPELDGIASDLLGAAVSEVNWAELAASKLNEVAENERYEAR